MNDRIAPRSFIALAAMALLIPAAPLTAQQDDQFKDVLSSQRVSEGRFGISLRPPLDTTLRRRTGDDAWVHIVKGREYAIAVYIRQTNREMKIDEVVKTATHEFGFRHPSSVEIGNRIVKPAGRPGWLLYFGVNLPNGVRPLDRARPDPKVLMEVAKLQMRTADTLRSKGRDIEAYRLYMNISKHSPDAADRLKAGQWVKAFQADRAFMERYLKDEALRRRNNERDADNAPWVSGQAFMQLAPSTFLEVNLDCDHERFEDIKPVFEAVIRSIEVQDPEEINEHRKRLIEGGDLFVKTLGHRVMRDVLLPEVQVPIVDDDGKPTGVGSLRLQYYRVLRDEQDVGWMKIVHRERRDQIVTLHAKLQGRDKFVWQPVIEEQGVMGIGVDVYARIHMNMPLPDGRVQAVAVDTANRCFQSQDGNYESWAMQTTLRPRTEFKDARPGAAAPVNEQNKPEDPLSLKARTWLETGVRNHDELTIIREGPSGISRHTWRKPPKGYINQVELFLVAPLLPRKDTAELAFYAYYPNTGSVSFRTLRVEPDKKTGRFTIYTRPSPDAIEQVSHYDADGMLISRDLGEDRSIIPTTREELAKLWKIELKDQVPGEIDLEHKATRPRQDRVPR